MYVDKYFNVLRVDAVLGKRTFKFYVAFNSIKWEVTFMSARSMLAIITEILLLT